MTIAVVGSKVKVEVGLGIGRSQFDTRSVGGISILADLLYRSYRSSAMAARAVH